MERNWNNIISAKRIGVAHSSREARTDFQRDFDRIIFSSAFRRLQNKTQIFPLPGSVFVHNRLTHSLEVASVGRSLGKLVGAELLKTGAIDSSNEKFYEFELQNVIASACLAHDIGNPPFGHSGEKAISNFFLNNPSPIIGSTALKDFFSPEEWADLISFEGNANSFRVLTNQFNGKSAGGYRLTYITLAALMKYPCVSSATNKKAIHRKKYGFFQTEINTAKDIFTDLNITPESESPLVYTRHPFVYLTEAADDICYRIIDFEDAQRLHILSHEEVSVIFLRVLEEINRPSINLSEIKKVLNSIGDKNEQISYLRAICINALTNEASDLFIKEADSILHGNYNSGLLDTLQNKYPILKEIADISYNQIYNHNTVVELEITGYNVMSDLLSLFIPAILTDKPNHKEEKVLKLLPEQFRIKSDLPYLKVMSVLDYLSGMTDPYIIELYRKTFGIEITWHL
ncbi:MAG TPA: dNTP triphosphohydrolase [Bacteroidales bacterium]|nr:dNTP triphosphohydrolase [Bacteroidales bacterium]